MSSKLLFCNCIHIHLCVLIPPSSPTSHFSLVPPHILLHINILPLFSCLGFLKCPIEFNHGWLYDPEFGTTIRAWWPQQGVHGHTECHTSLAPRICPLPTDQWIYSNLMRAFSLHSWLLGTPNFCGPQYQYAQLLWVQSISTLCHMPESMKISGLRCSFIISGKEFKNDNACAWMSTTMSYLLYQ